jgi:hypothetical protein
MRRYREKIHEEIGVVLEELKETLDNINKDELFQYAKLDMFCLELNNLLKKEKFKYRDVKDICSNTYWDFKNMKLDMSGYKLGRRALCFFAKHRLTFFVYLLCLIKMKK